MLRIKPRIIVLLAAMLALDAALLTMQTGRVRELETLLSQLSKTHASLNASVNNLRAQLRIVQASPPEPVAGPPANDAKFIPVSLAAIKNLYFPILDKNTNPRTDPIGPWALKISTDSVGWLGLNDDETKNVQNVFSRAQERIEAHIRTTAQEVSETDSPDKDMLAKTKIGGGNYSFYSIPPLDDDEVASLQKFIAEGLADAVGQDRADVMMEKLSSFAWLNNGTRMDIAFRDLDSPPHGIFTEESKYTTTNYVIFPAPTKENPKPQPYRLTRPIQGNPIPPELSFLFKPAKDDPSQWRQLVK
jgi:hypothetical protein